jgi:hypothetical protein
MWKTLKPGEKVLPGNVIRYRSDPRHLTSVQDRVYDVVKTDQHYFEIALRCDKECGNEPEKEILKYMDIGYHINLEIWTGAGLASLSPVTEKDTRTI